MPGSVEIRVHPARAGSCTETEVNASVSRAHAARRARTARVTGIPLALGVACGVIGSALITVSDVSSTAWTIGAELTVCCLPLLLLSAPPTERRNVTLASLASIAFFVGIGATNARTALAMHAQAARLPSCATAAHLFTLVHAYGITAVHPWAAALLTAARHLRRLLASSRAARALGGAISTREQLAHLWSTAAWVYAVCALAWGWTHALVGSTTPRYATTGLCKIGIPFLVVFLCCAAFCANGRVRRRLHAWLVARGDGIGAAAGIAVLIGNADPRSAVADGERRLRAVPCAQLTVDVFASSAVSAHWIGMSVPAELDAVDAFVSHSWHDPAGPKFDALMAWRGDFISAHKREPLVWLDRCCITRLGDDLPHLPIFLAASRQLLILAGPTWTKRLWCLVECFVFDQMKPDLHGADAPTLAALAQLRLLPGCDEAVLATVDVNTCECAHRDDYDRLIGVLEAAYGSVEVFNERARFLLQRLPRGGGADGSTPPARPSRLLAPISSPSRSSHGSGGSCGDGSWRLSRTAVKGSAAPSGQGAPAAAASGAATPPAAASGAATPPATDAACAEFASVTLTRELTMAAPVQPSQPATSEAHVAQPAKRQVARRRLSTEGLLSALVVCVYVVLAAVYSRWAHEPGAAECDWCDARLARLRATDGSGWVFATDGGARASAGRAWRYSAQRWPNGRASAALPWDEAARACGASFGGALARPADSAEERLLLCVLGEHALSAWVARPASDGHAPRDGAGAAEAARATTRCPELAPWGVQSIECTYATHYVCEAHVAAP
ncbi:hypothetical protein KFE25_010547 [Diacronema lutheri]|uniref:Uncharacterized protein n=1 Tax=Diacronema lutheri TaxID=2081491 RepID=A0A8J6C997_DIALT|nr:hypothetical protein KFE25_010547 [Diacronema lutheri]